MFENVYEEFIQEDSYHVTMKLVNSGTDLLHSLENIKDIFGAILISLQNNYDLDEPLGSLSLLLDAGSTYRDFVGKLASIQNLYSKLCSLALIEEEEFPLRVVKIESGSLFVKIFGEPRIIGFMIALIENTVGFVYMNVTKEGKIESVNQKTAALGSLIEMRKSPVAAGISVDELDKELNDASVFIARELTYLFTGESKISINGEVLQIQNNDNKQKLLESTNKYLIEGAKDNPRQDE